jgi:hypothetical protein
MEIRAHTIDSGSSRLAACANCADKKAETAADGKKVSGEDRVSIKAAIKRELSQEEIRIVESLKARDREVRAHEQAHKSAAGPYASGNPSYQYQTGPDGVRYAVGGEVSIDTAPVPGEPDATVRKAQTVRQAALAPAQPSAQDRRVAAEAAEMEAEARRQLAAEKAETERQESRATAEKSPRHGPDNSRETGESQPDPSARRKIRGFSGPDLAATGNLLNLIA